MTYSHDVQGEIYIVVDYHRKASYIANKSQWLVTIDEEMDCFRNTINNNWKENENGWGIRWDAGHRVLVVLGKSVSQYDLKIAKFTKDVNLNHWHGYPADWQQRTQDRPPIKILNDWRTTGFISKHKMAKIRNGKKCDL